MRITSIRVFLALLLGLLATPAVAFAQARAGVIDLQRAVRECDAGLRAQAQLRQIYDTRQTDLDHRQAQLRTDREQLERLHGSIPADEYTRRYAAFTDQLSRLQTDYMAYQRDLQHREEELTRPILEQIRTIVRELRLQRGLEIIVDSASVIDGAVPAHTDITAEVIQIYNARFGRAGTRAGSSSSP